ncbi:MAG: Crp/Fnr family transcriptional regulator, partial [Butyrivibrio sp.]|nr:Crp/Fnr family transcriptional regulator [Butyrivibrio sp.]
MGLQTIAKGQILHKAASDSVNTVEVLVKGKIKIYDQYTQVVLNVGGIIGLIETPGKEYSYTYEALEDSAVYSYPYTSDDDLQVVIRSNPKICGYSLTSWCDANEGPLEGRNILKPGLAHALQEGW